MSFQLDTFDNVTSGMSKGPKIWSYSNSIDTLADIMVMAYFEAVKERLNKDDLIYVSASDDVELLKVTSTNGQTPTTVVFVPASGGAPSDATYITQTPNADLTNEQALSLLSSGLLKSATGTGVVSIAIPNTDYQVGSAALTSIAGLTTAVDEMIYTTASNVYATTGLTAAGRALIDDATAGDQRNSLGLGTIATQNSNNVMITGGSITGITDLAIADGGTAASTNTGAINNLVSGASLTTTTVAGTDLVMIQDVSDSNNLKSVTAQSIADLTVGTVTSVSGTAGRITSTGGATPVIDIDATYVGQNSIVTVGTITSGTWAATTLAINHGGTAGTTNTDAINNLVNNASLTSTTVATGDLVLIQDISDTNNLKSVTAQSIANLASAGVTSVSGTANRITSTGGSTPVIDIDAAYVGQSSITTLGTISSGTWGSSATVIAPASGGTGVSNTGTFTVGGNTAFSGAYTFTGTLTNNTSITFPTSGTLLTTTGSGVIQSSGPIPLTIANITGCHTTAFQLLAAQGSGTMICVVGIVFKLVVAGTAYTLSGTNALGFTNGSVSGLTTGIVATISIPSGTFSGVTNSTLYYYCPASSGAWNASSVPSLGSIALNTGIYMSASGAITGGTGAGNSEAIVFYYVVTP